MAFRLHVQVRAATAVATRSLSRCCHRWRLVIPLAKQSVLLHNALSSPVRFSSSSFSSSSPSWEELKSNLVQRHDVHKLNEDERAEAREYLNGMEGVEADIRDMQEQLNDLLGEQRVDEAKDVGLVLKETVASFYGEDHPVYASTMNNLGMVHRMALEWEAALECYTNAVRVYRDKLGDKHLNTTVAIENHAHAYKAMAATKKGMERLQLLEWAKELFEEALATKERALGDYNVQVGVTMQSLGAVLRLLGGEKNRVKAGHLVADGSKMVRDILPRNQAVVATAYNNLAFDQKQEGLFREAEVNYKEALDIREEIFGPEHPETMVVLNNLAELYVELEEPQLAAELQQRILEIVGYEENEEEFKTFEQSMMKKLAPKKN